MDGDAIGTGDKIRAAVGGVAIAFVLACRARIAPPEGPKDTAAGAAPGAPA